MNKIYGIAVVGLGIFMLFIIWSNLENENIIIEDIDIDNTLDQTTVEAGQIWLSKTDDPFNEDTYWYVVEIRAGYVSFTNIKYNKDEDFWVIPNQITYLTNSRIDIFKNIYVRVK